MRYKIIEHTALATQLYFCAIDLIRRELRKRNTNINQNLLNGTLIDMSTQLVQMAYDALKALGCCGHCWLSSSSTCGSILP